MSNRKQRQDEAVSKMILQLAAIERKHWRGRIPDQLASAWKIARKLAVRKDGCNVYVEGYGLVMQKVSERENDEGEMIRHEILLVFVERGRFICYEARSDWRKYHNNNPLRINKHEALDKFLNFNMVD